MLTHAIKIQNETAVRSLLRIGADVNEQDRRGVAPLSAAAYKGSLNILNMIISAGANINAQNHSGSTALIQVYPH
jgi:ankyrin repeat protein